MAVSAASVSGGGVRCGIDALQPQTIRDVLRQCLIAEGAAEELIDQLAFLLGCFVVTAGGMYPVAHDRFVRGQPYGRGARGAQRRYPGRP
jgi:hypothetical protein